jgi:hypothetical protein
MNKIYVYLFFTLLLISACERKVDDWQEGFLQETLLQHNDKRLLNYDAISENSKQTVWREEFDNNDSNFPFDISITQNFITTTIQDGMLVIDYTREKYLQYDIPFTIDENRNFEIELKFLISDDIFNQKPILVFSSSESLKYLLYLEEYSLAGEERTDIFLKKDSTIGFQLFDWNSKDYLNLNDFSIITIRKIGSKYAFFINHKLFYILNDKEFSCNKSYIVLSRGENIFDYVKVSYITE